MMLSMVSAQMGKWDEHFTYSAELGTDNLFRLYWSLLDDDVIDIGIEANCTGWIAVGLSPNGGMEHSDIMLGWVDDVDGTVILQDRYTESTYDPTGRDDVVLSGLGTMIAITFIVVVTFKKRIVAHWFGEQSVTKSIPLIFGGILSIADGADSKLVYNPTTIQSQLPWIVVILTLFCCFILLEVFEHGLGMQPKLTTDAELRRHAEQSSLSLDPKDRKFAEKSNYEMNRRLSKSIDADGYFRMQRRAAVLFIKGCVYLLALIRTVLMWLVNPQWLKDHFVDFVAESVYFPPLQYSIAMIVGVYIFEILSDRYGKVPWSLLLHHWLTILAALAMFSGLYNPFGYWYAVTLIGMHFPTPFMMGFRAQDGLKYPDFTRKGFTFCFYWLIWLLTLNGFGQILLIINWAMNHFNDSVPMTMVVATVVCAAFWFYDDVLALKALKAFSTQKYEVGDLAKAIHFGNDRQPTTAAPDNTK